MCLNCLQLQIKPQILLWLLTQTWILITIQRFWLNLPITTWQRRGHELKTRTADALKSHFLKTQDLIGLDPERLENWLDSRSKIRGQSLFYFIHFLLCWVHLFHSPPFPLPQNHLRFAKCSFTSLPLSHSHRQVEQQLLEKVHCQVRRYTYTMSAEAPQGGKCFHSAPTFTNVVVDTRRAVRLPYAAHVVFHVLYLVHERSDPRQRDSKSLKKNENPAIFFF